MSFVRVELPEAGPLNSTGPQGVKFINRVAVVDDEQVPEIHVWAHRKRAKVDPVELPQTEVAGEVAANPVQPTVAAEVPAGRRAGRAVPVVPDGPAVE